ncbi:DUF1351 domain-containing protein [Salicibibacter cibarius]|uniref:DUF1351 domain-containing protein n=1 Tax=Salicibibacter cibarius TaxID=2743000 RepID=A0A7T7CAP0_9BACI|nr:DUF1351 domain-containing protein [Salicibibacter cibarius]QQK75065.1 DUF1351 domain-containing protein [Salicibibacter cibarius]QQK75127.1 DUF1351 domain-containing protein [Salicibibacter cibarius]
MEEQQLTIDVSSIQVQPGNVTFDGYENLKDEALYLAKQIEVLKVDEENIKTSKKMLATINSRVKELEDKRISIKKQMLEPYNEFEKQVKEIVKIVKEADETVRGQVRQLEEEERQSKREQIEILWDKRIGQYQFKDFFRFEDFLQAKHLNKSTSLNTVEKELVDWLEQRDQEIKHLQTLDNKDEILAEYKQSMNLVDSINTVQNRHKEKEQVSQQMDKGSKSKSYMIVFSNEAEYEFAKMLLNEKELNFETKVDE